MKKNKYLENELDLVELRKMRKDMGLSQENFCKRFGLTPSAYSKWEQKYLIPSSAAASYLRLLIQLHGEGYDLSS